MPKPVKKVLVQARVPAPVREALRQIAKKDGRSIANYVEMLIERHVTNVMTSGSGE